MQTSLRNALRCDSGIGRASAIALGKEGWTVVVTARDEAKLKDTASQIEKSHVIAGDLVSLLPCCFHYGIYLLA